MSDRERINEHFARYIVSPRLLEQVERARQDANRGTSERRPRGKRIKVILELDVDFPEGLDGAKTRTRELLQECGVSEEAFTTDRSRYNVFALLTPDQVGCLASRLEGLQPRPVYRVWEDEPLRAFLIRSVRTIKADACFTAYGANGAGIVWAIADSGIDATHPHFVFNGTTDLPGGLQHRDFSAAPGAPEQPLVDLFGHGTHVAGIVAGETPEGGTKWRLSEERDATGTVRPVVEKFDAHVRSVAPKAKLLSLKVLDDKGGGHASNLISALEWLEEVNDHGRRIRVHGVNLSLGYPFDASWFAAGHSPLCVVVDRLSRSGVVVVAAAGNDGSAFIQSEGRRGTQRVGLDQSINDPGNAEEAITVGATHGDAPHRFGVSYFSSRGPTADGRMKPDLVAPGERILSCAASGSASLAKALQSASAAEKVPPEQGSPDAQDQAGAQGGAPAAPDPAGGASAYFREESGTSMAAPHVSGAVAALLSIRAEFIGRPDRIKQILIAACTDLGRKRDYQGAGLIDLMRAIQSV